MSKKSIRDFSELRSLLKKTETEAEAKAAMKGGNPGPHKMPKRPLVPVKHRPMSAIDKFIVDTLAIPLERLPLDQLHDARISIQDASECVNNSMLSIQRQLESTETHSSDDWKKRATAALRFKVNEGVLLQQRLKLTDELISRMKPALKLVEPSKPIEPPKPAPPKVVATTSAYEIRTDAPRPNTHQSDEWRKYPFDKLGIGQSFRFGTETSDQVRRFITSAQRHLNRHFSYRTERDGVLAVWRVEAPSRGRK
jgi:hypothetical protein